MKKKMAFFLDEYLHEKLKTLCHDDEDAMQAFASKVVEKELYRLEDKDTEKENEKIEDYLKQGKQGNRSYGIKGQGW